jgi:rod shape determining protein RodA
MKFRDQDFDLALFLISLFLSIIGVLLIYSAKRYSPGGQEIFLKQIFWIILGIIAMGICFTIPIRFHEIFSYVYFTMGIFSLIGLLALGSPKVGAIRWFQLGPFSFQSSEFMKIAFVLALARHLSYSKRLIFSLKWFFSLFILVFLPFALVLKQPDLGTSLVFLAGFLSISFWAGISWLYLLFLVSPLLSLLSSSNLVIWAVFFCLFLVLLYLLKPNFAILVGSLVVNIFVGLVGTLVWNNLPLYQQMRIRVFLDPSMDSQGAGYQILQSKVAIGSGGLFGKGFLHGTQTKLAFLPAQHNDFIFSVLGEEFGFFGSLLLIALFVFLILKGFAIACKARSKFSSYTAFGITSILAFQVLVNIGMVIGLVPVTGIPLPLVSYGGSSMLTFWIMIGLLLAINARWYEY